MNNFQFASADIDACLHVRTARIANLPGT